MRKVISLGVNSNPKYLYYIPLVAWAWRKIGWEVRTFYCGKMDFIEKLMPSAKYNVRECLKYDPHGTETIAQVVRLYAACVEKDCTIMTSDADMLPLSDYWKPNGGVTTYGRNLSDRHYPICYIAMNDELWRKVMDIKNDLYGVHLRRDLRVQKDKWTLDQDLVTERLLEYGKENITHIDRPIDKRTGYPVGRVDRSNWRLDHNQLIDAHLPHDVLTNEQSFQKVLKLLHHVWPREDWNWFITYHKEFKKKI